MRYFLLLAAALLAFAPCSVLAAPNVPKTPANVTAGCVLAVTAPAETGLWAGRVAGINGTEIAVESFPLAAENVLGLFDRIEAGETSEHFVPEGELRLWAEGDDLVLRARDSLICTSGVSIAVTFDSDDRNIQSLSVVNASTQPITRIRLQDRLAPDGEPLDYLKGDIVAPGEIGLLGPDGIPEVGLAILDAENGAQWAFSYHLQRSRAATLITRDSSGATPGFCAVSIESVLPDDVDVLRLESMSGQTLELLNRRVHPLEPGGTQSILAPAGSFAVTWVKSAQGGLPQPARPLHKTALHQCSPGQELTITLGSGQ
jgi:hypothetical protein